MHAAPTSWSELPQTGTTIVREGYALEFKREVNPKDRAELAKDVALLANVFGGLLLIGADETDAGVDYRGLPHARAKLVADAYAEAVRDFCSPRPIFSVAEILHPTESYIVVVCVAVEPFPDQPVGVAVPDQLGRPTDGWRFPVRANRHAIFLRSEQLMMWFNPQTRRTAIALSEIPTGSLVQFLCSSGSRSNLQRFTGRATLVAWSIVENYVEFQPFDNHFAPFRAPLEDVESIWHSGKNERSVRLKGAVVPWPERGEGQFRYHAGF